MKVDRYSTTKFYVFGRHQLSVPTGKYRDISQPTLYFCFGDIVSPVGITLSRADAKKTLANMREAQKKSLDLF